MSDKVQKEKEQGLDKNKLGIKQPHGAVWRKTFAEESDVEGSTNVTNEVLEEKHDQSGFSQKKTVTFQEPVQAKNSWTWKELFYGLSQITTFHGIRYTTEPGWKSRRSVWVTIVLGALSGFLYLLSVRCLQYYSWATNVNAKIVNKDAMMFPAVTLCNQNYLRATRSYKEGLYDVVSGNFSQLTIQESNFVYGSCQKGEQHAVILRSMGIKRFENTRFRDFAKVTFEVCTQLCEAWNEIPIDEKRQCLASEFFIESSLCRLYEIEYIPFEEYKATLSLTPKHDMLFYLKKPCSLDTGDGAVINVHATINAIETLDNAEDIYLTGVDLWHDDWIGFVNKSAHQKERMIHSCSWKGVKCGPETFQKVITDYGVCYTFNPPNPEIRTTGSTFGLKLIVNVEEYEYMPGPNSDAGIKVFLHDPNELPMVRDLGFAVPPGRHSLIGIKVEKIFNMPPPHGECGRKELEHFKKDEYSLFRCARDCEIKAVVKTCGCRDIYMEPDKNGGPPICDMSQYFKCVLPTMKMNAKVIAENKCICEKPCEQTVYEPVVSNAALSSLSINEILAHNQAELKARKLEASDTQVRVQYQRFIEIVKALYNVREAYNSFRDDLMLIAKGFNAEYIEPIVATFKGIVKVFQSDMNMKLFYQLDEVIEDLDIIFGPGKDTLYFMIERVIRNSNLLTMHIRNYIAEDYAYSRMGEIINDTVEYADAVVFTLPKYQAMVQSVSTSLTSFGFTAGDFPFLPLFIAKKSEECAELALEFNNMTFQMKDKIEEIQKDVSNKLAGVDVDINLREEMILFKKYENDYNSIKTKCLDPYFNMANEIKAFNASFNEGLGAHIALDYTFDFDYEAQDQTRERRQFKEIMDSYLQTYTMDKKYLQGNLSEDLLNGYIATERALIDKIKIRLSERLSRRMDIARGDIVEWYEKLFTLAEELKGYMAPDWGLRRMIKSAQSLDVWKAPVAVATLKGQAECKCQYNFTNIDGTFANWTDDDYLGPKGKQKVHEIMDAFFKPIFDAMNEFDKLVNEEEQSLSSALKNARNLMTTLRENDEMNQAFIANNFLVMDVFFSELKEYQITEYEAFAVEDLIGDIGGYMALMIGASVVTVLEVLDLVIYNGFKKEVGTKNPKKKSESVHKYV